MVAAGVPLRPLPPRPRPAWLPCDAWQYDSAVEVARLFRMRLVVARVVPMWGWDTYRAGTGRMLGKALGLVPVADGSGPEFDIGELTTWLNDAVLLAPGVLLHPRTIWPPVSDDGVRVSVTDAGRTVSAEVLLDDDRPRDFRTEDRWIDLPGGGCRRRPPPDRCGGPGRSPATRAGRYGCPGCRRRTGPPRSCGWTAGVVGVLGALLVELVHRTSGSSRVA